MTLHQLRRGRRGFTLIELLVVIAIIAVLISLLMSGVMAVFAARDRAGNKYDLGKLDASMKTALGEYRSKPQTLPGRLVLYNNIDVYRNPGTYGITAASTPVNLTELNRSKDALSRMFGNQFIRTGGTVNWDGGGSTGAMILEGQQCLVFYLGGISSNSGGVRKMLGFSTNTSDPTDLSSKERYGPYYNFESGRLADGTNYNSYGAPASFYVYLDRYETPFAYFGGTGSANSYIPDGCPKLGVTAYSEGSGKYTNPTTFQIISAGKDKVFGVGGLWDPKAGSSSGPARDDMANFSQSVLASPQS